MKLLLTSDGITNPTLAASLLKLAGKPIEDIKIAFIPTAANMVDDDKLWVMDNMLELRNAGFTYVDIVDISALPKEVWLSRLEKADIFVVGGGFSFYLLEEMHKSGFAEGIRELLKTRVYMGISAGSMATGPDMPAETLKLVYPQDTVADEKGLHLVDFYILPHLHNKWFPLVNEENMKIVAKQTGYPIYVLDDGMAVEINENTVSVIGEGEYLSANL